MAHTRHRRTSLRHPDAAQKQMLREEEENLGIQVFKEEDRPHQVVIMKPDPNWKPTGDKEEDAASECTSVDADNEVSELCSGSTTTLQKQEENGKPSTSAGDVQEDEEYVRKRHWSIKQKRQDNNGGSIVALTPAIDVPRTLVLEEKENVPVGKFEPPHPTVEEAIRMNQTEPPPDIDEGDDVELISRVRSEDSFPEEIATTELPQVVETKIREIPQNGQNVEKKDDSPQEDDIEKLPDDPTMEDDEGRQKRVAQMSQEELSKRARARERLRLLRGIDAGGLGVGMAPGNAKLSPIRELERETTVPVLVEPPTPDPPSEPNAGPFSEKGLAKTTSKDLHVTNNNDRGTAAVKISEPEKQRIECVVNKKDNGEVQKIFFKKPNFIIGGGSPDSGASTPHQQSFEEPKSPPPEIAEEENGMLKVRGKYRVHKDALSEFAPRRMDRKSSSDALDNWDPYDPHPLVKERLTSGPLEPVVTTKFVDWCARSFADPLMHLFKMPQSPKFTRIRPSPRGFETFEDEYGQRDSLQEDETPRKRSLIRKKTDFIDDAVAPGVEWDVPENKVEVEATPSDWTCYMDDAIKQQARAEFKSFRPSSRREIQQPFAYELPTRCSCLAMSRLRPYMYASDGRQLHMLRYDAAESAMPLARSFAANDNNPFNEDEISQLLMVNEMTDEMIAACSSSTGLFRLWCLGFNEYGYTFEKEPKLVAAAYLLRDIHRVRPWDERFTTAFDHTHFDWDQDLGRMIMCGNVPVVRIWDAHAEKTALDIRVGTSNQAMHLCADLHQSRLLVVGFDNGQVEALDPRVANAGGKASVFTVSTPRLVNAALHTDSQRGIKLVIADVSGNVRVYDPRQFKDPVVSVNACDGGDLRRDRETITHMEFHPQAEVLALYTSRYALKILDVDGRHLGTVSSSNRGPKGLTTFRWHPLRFLLATASLDRSVAAYGLSSQPAVALRP